MKSNDIFPSKYLKAEDLDNDVTVTIDRVIMEKLKDPATGEESEKACVYFKNAKKGLLINKTNWKLLVKVTGEEESDNWKGKSITLTVTSVPAFGDVVDAIRIKSGRSTSAKIENQTPENSASSEALEKDDIPF